MVYHVSGSMHLSVAAQVPIHKKKISELYTKVDPLY